MLDELALRHGVERVAWLADRAVNHDLVLATTVGAEFAALVDPATGRIPVAPARTWLEEHFASARLRAYKPPAGATGRELFAYCYTDNNRRELDFLQARLAELGVPVAVENLCDWSYSVRVGVERPLAEALLRAMSGILGERSQIAPGLLHQLGKFGSTVQSALDSLSLTGCHVLCVANDHAPAPVAVACVARAMGSRLIYLQHAEVTPIFPPLDFDLSILRNLQSADVYRAVGESRGVVVVAARDARGWTAPEAIASSRAHVAASPTASVVVYPSSVMDADRYRSLIEELKRRPEVSSVSVKPHPNTREPMPSVPSVDVPELDRVPNEPHVAVCGNSSIVIELVERGHVVFQDFTLDGLTPDYYGFVARGLASPWPLGPLGERFWSVAGPLDANGERNLGRYVAHLRTPQNEQAAQDVAPALMDVLTPILPGAAPKGRWNTWRRFLFGL